MSDRLSSPAVAPKAPIFPPQVHADGRVTFRLHAPKASAVSVDGDWITQGLASGGVMSRDEAGVWSLTVGPLPPDFYLYTYVVDGVESLGSDGPLVKTGNSPARNILGVPGEAAAWEAMRDTPYGELHAILYKSPATGAYRTMRTYTPPGYEIGESRYPVLYLISGGGDDDKTWLTIGRAQHILNNLIDEGVIEPMIVIFPNGVTRHMRDLRLYGQDRRDETKVQDRIEAVSAAHDLFVDELTNTIIPLIDGRYRTLADPEHRAVAGLSMGGAETLRVAPSRPDLFASIGVFSMGLQVGHDQGVDDDFVERNATFFADPAATNARIKQFYIAAGDNDQVVTDGPRKLSACLAEHGIEHTFVETSGGHTWINWRRYLREFLPLLFR